MRPHFHKQIVPVSNIESTDLQKLQRMIIETVTLNISVSFLMDDVRQPTISDNIKETGRVKRGLIN